MKKVFLSLVAVLLCGVTFAQTPISTKDQFMAIQANGNYILTADIDLGDLGEITSAVIPQFEGTFDGDGHSITYQATFNGSDEDGYYGLFGQVIGTIRKLDVNGNITMNGGSAGMQVAILCGQLGGRTWSQTGTIEYCNVYGNLNSTVQASDGGGTDAGLIVGFIQRGTLQYCTGQGNVVGVGFVGGLIGQMEADASAKACSFAGNVTAQNPRTTYDNWGYGSYAGGICGAMREGAEITFCLVDAHIESQTGTSGVGSVAGTRGWGTTDDDEVAITLTNSYAEGELNGVVINADGITTAEQGTTTPNYYEGQMDPEDIVAALNAANTDPNFFFAVVNGNVVLIIGQSCNAPSNLRVTPHTTYADLEWDAPAGATRFEVTITGGNIITETGAIIEEVNRTTYRATGVGASVTPYQVTVRTICGENNYSEAVTTAFNSTCPNINGLTVNNITHETATATWTSTESTTFTVRLYEGNDIINSTPMSTINITEPQAQASINLSSLDAATQYTIEVVASCGTNVNVEANHSILTFTTKPVNFETAQSGNFNDHNTWVGGIAPEGNVADITINTGHRVTVNHDLVITGTYKIVDNKGALQITQQGQLINTTGVNVPGIVEIVSPQKTQNKWTFVGAPFAGYKLNAVMPVSGSDVAMVKYNYTSGEWSNDWAHVGTSMEAAEGTFAWPFYEGVISFTTYGDLCTWNATANNGEGAWVAGSYDFTKTPDYALNNGNVTVTKTIVNSSNGNWMALSNPYPAKLDVEAFLAEENNAGIQGNCVYVFRNGSFDINPTETGTGTQGLSDGDILMTEGFFVNFEEPGNNKSVTFTKEQLSYYFQPAPQAKTSSNEFIELTLQNGNDKVRVYFAQNEDAEQGYDIFDANKMFATTGVAEPYFVTDGIALIKEEVAELPYYATMNVRSQQDTVMNFVLTNLPEGYAVSIIDGEEVIDLVEGGVYSTEILTGENADRFKVLVKKNVGLADVEELDVTIINSNRHISITAQEDVKVTVYNTLGQRVFETEKTDFVLSGVASGAYVVKVQGAKAAKSQKIIVE